MPYNILLVDDDEEFREEIGAFLEEYSIVEASSAKKALEILGRPNTIDLALLDVMLPDIKGTELLAEIRRMSPELGIIVLTGFGSKEVVVEALRGDADNYIEKTGDISKIKTCIEELLEEKGLRDPLDTGTTEEKIETIKAFVKKNWDKKITLSDAASRICLSPKYLSRIFKKSTGMSFRDYKISVKTDKAKRLLDTTGFSVEQISYRLGYLNSESFIRIFKKSTGFTPSEFRRGKDRRRSRKRNNDNEK